MARKKEQKWVGGVQGWMDSKEAAEWLTISRRALTDLCGDGRIKFKKPGKKRLFCLAELYRYVESTRTAASGAAGVPHRVWQDDVKFTTEEACRFLGISERTMTRKCAEREITFYRPARERRFLKSDLEAWLDAVA